MLISNLLGGAFIVGVGVDVDPALGFSDCVDVGSVADVFEIAFIFRVEVSTMGECLCT
jgi:hypothetical protein